MVDDAVQVSFSALDDSWVEPGAQAVTIRHTLSSLDPAYDSQGVCVKANVDGSCGRRVAPTVADVVVTIEDNDVAGVDVVDLSVDSDGTVSPLA